MDLKNFFLCKYFRLIGKLKYPNSIIPKIGYNPSIDINNLLAQHEIAVLRSSNKKTEDCFTELGTLRDGIIPLERVPNLSMNLLGGFYEPSFIVFRTLLDGNNRWLGKEKIYLSNHLRNYEIQSTCSPIFFKVSDLNNISIPYSKPNSPDSKKLLNNLKLKYEDDGVNLNANAKIVVEHAPTNLNYWHVELCIIDSSSHPVIKHKNHFQQSILGHILSHILAVKCSSTIFDNLQVIQPSNYKLS